MLMIKRSQPLYAVILFVWMLLAGGQAQAHVTVSPDQAAAGSWFRTAFRVPHGCDGSATIAIAITVPDGVLAVKPQMKPGWRIDIQYKTPDHPLKGPHGMVEKIVGQVIWRGGPLPDAYFDEFGLSMKMPDAPGTTLYFPVVQQCEKGVNRWIQIPAKGQTGGGADMPAPFVTLKATPAKAPDAMSHHHHP
jgi:uncharacterized protein YcnI